MTKVVDSHMDSLCGSCFHLIRYSVKDLEQSCLVCYCKMSSASIKNWPSSSNTGKSMWGPWADQACPLNRKVLGMYNFPYSFTNL
jgi:hypothetical protein